MYGKHLSDETRQKLSQAMSGKHHPNYGKRLSEETRRKMSEARKGKRLSEETKRKIVSRGGAMKLSEPQRRVLWFMQEARYQPLFINQEAVGEYRFAGMRPAYVSSQPRRDDLMSLERMELVSCFGPIARREYFSLTPKGREVAKELQDDPG